MSSEQGEFFGEKFASLPFDENDCKENFVLLDERYFHINSRFILYSNFILRAVLIQISWNRVIAGLSSQITFQI